MSRIKTLFIVVNAVYAALTLADVPKDSVDWLTDAETVPEDVFLLAEEPEVPIPIAQRAIEADGLIQQRVDQEQATLSNPFVITPHKPNYFLPLAFTHNPNDREYPTDLSESLSLQDVEFKFQLSVKFPVAFNLLGRRNASLWFAYSQQAHWQAYNSDISSPFRDTNHEPEAFLSLQNKTSLLGIKPTLIRYGVIHQSNGQIEPISRSWNRIYADFVFEKADTVISFKPWYRLPEATAEDDNPNIERYLGYAELTAVHVFDDYSIDLLLRNNLRKDNKGTFQLGFSFPAWGKMRGYVQYFNGYGQSLLDYNNKTQSIGLGVMLTNWL